MIVEAPVNSLEGAKLQISMGAKSIYAGLATPEMNNHSMTGRGKKSIGGVKPNIESYDEFKEIVKVAHDQGVEVLYTANVSTLAQPFESSFIRHVERGVEAGVDSIIVGDLASLLICKENKYNVPIYISTFFDNLNSAQLDMFSDLGATLVVLPHHLTETELRDIASKTKMGLIMSVNSGCSNNNGRCTLFHSDEVGIPCRNHYKVCLDGKEYSGVQIMDASEDCAICAIPFLLEIGVRALKIVDRSIPAEQVAPYTKLFSDAIKAFSNGATVKEFKSTLIKRAPWWENIYCKQEKCKYIRTSKTAWYC